MSDTIVPSIRGPALETSIKETSLRDVAVYDTDGELSLL